MTNDDSENERNSMEPKTFWSDGDKTRQFLIPDSYQLPPGDFLLRTTTGREQRVNPAALAGFEVSDEEAKAWLKEQLGEVMKKLGRGLRETLSGKPKEGGATDEVKKSATTNDAKKPKPTPGLDLLADITGTPRENLQSDYAAIGKALRAYLGDMAGTAVDAVSGEPERMQAARKRMDQWAETLQNHGISSPDVTEPSTEISASTHMPVTQKESAPSESVLSPKEKERASLSNQLRDLAEDFRRRADALAATRKATGADRVEASEDGIGSREENKRGQGADLPVADAKQAADALEAAALGLEDAAGDAADWLRDVARRLRSDSKPDGSNEPSAGDNGGLTRRVPDNES